MAVTVVFLGREGLRIFPVASNEPLILAFPQNAVKDLDLVDATVFDGLIGKMIEQNKLLPNDLLVVLSPDICFLQDTAAKEGMNPETLAKEFADEIPFNALGVRTYQVPNGVRVVAANRELYEALVGSFTRRGFRPLGVIPAVMIEGLEGGTPLDYALAKALVGDLDRVRAKRLDIATVEPVNQGDEEMQLAPRPGKSRTSLYFLLGVFGLLLVILVVLLVSRLTAK